MEYYCAHSTDSKTKAHGLPPRSQAAPIGCIWSPRLSNSRVATQLTDLDSLVPPGSGGEHRPTITSSINNLTQWLGDSGMTKPLAGSLLVINWPVYRIVHSRLHNKCMLRELSSPCPEWERARLLGRVTMPVGAMEWGFCHSWLRDPEPWGEQPGQGREPGALHSCSCFSLFARALTAPTHSPDPQLASHLLPMATEATQTRASVE